MKPVAFLDSDGFPWSIEGIQWRTQKDTYRPLYLKPGEPLHEGIIGQLSSHPKFSHIETPLLLEFARLIETLHGIKADMKDCLYCSESVCEKCWTLDKPQMMDLL